MGNFAGRTPRQKPVVMNCAITTKEYKKRDGSTGKCGIFKFSDGDKTYVIQTTKDGDTGKVDRKGRKITGWAQVARFVKDGGGDVGW